MAIVNRPGKPPYATAKYSIEDHDPIVRCGRMFRFNFTTFYGIYRTATLRDNFQVTTTGIDCAFSHFFPELMLSQLAVMRGRVKVLPEIFYLHEEHEANFARTPKVTDPRRAAALSQQFQRTLSKQLELVGVSQAQAQRHIQKWYGLLPDLGQQKLAARRKPSGEGQPALFTGGLAPFRYREFGNLLGASSSLNRLRRFLNRTWRQVMNLVVRDGTIYRRSLSAADWSGQETEWREAIRLMTTHPQGIGRSEIAEPRAA
jgi:hypothetical protein